MSGGVPAVAVSLVTYWGAEHLPRLHASLAAQRYPADRLRLIVVDNDPAHRARDWFAAHDPAATVLVPDRNLGYAGGNALATEAALAGGADYVLVLTQDTWLEPGALDALVAAAEARPRAGAVQPKMVRTDAAGRTVIHSWGNELHYTGVGFVGGDGTPDRPLAPRPIAYPSGAGALYRAAALREVGGFDPALFMYHEDTDLGWRLRLAGWEAWLAPEAVLHHDWDFARSTAKLYWVERNRLINVLTHYRLRTLLLLLPALASFEVVALGYALRGGWLGRRLAVYGHFLRPAAWRHLRAKRRWVQRLRRVGDRALAPWLAARFEFGPLAAHAVVRRVLSPLFAGYWACVRPLIVW